MLQSEALDILKTGANVFLTGEPGSGKTFVTNAYVRYLKRAKVEVAVTASTGIAATHLGGMTIHSWSGIGIHKLLSRWDMDRIVSNERVATRVERTKALVIDEISMLDGNTLESVDRVCREIKRKSEPFGGMQIVFVGDFFQLPPVAKDGEPLPQFAFTSQIWGRTSPLVCYLSEQYRQEDKIFLEILAALRRNRVSSDHCAHLEQRRSASSADSKNILKLYSHNVDVDEMNTRELIKIPGLCRQYDMTVSGRHAFAQQLKRGCLSPEQLLLKKSASVMFTKNSLTGAFVNGTLGVVIDFQDGTNFPIVKTRNGRTITAEPMEWTMEENNRILAKIRQVPLRLAWAITIHKSQGMSLDAAFIDLQRAFVPGQGYVALSRVRSLSGLSLSGWNAMALQVHPQVLVADGGFQQQSVQTRDAFGRIPTDQLETMHRNFLHACGGKRSDDHSSLPRSHKKYSVERIRKNHPNAYQSWSEEEDEQLVERYTAGDDIDELSNIFGRQKSAIRARLIALELVEN